MQLNSALKLAIVAWVTGSCARDLYTPVVTTQQGRLRGLRNFQGQNRYYSIPYAFSQRFQLPKNPPNWTGVYDAINPLRSCAQIFVIFTIGNEDCLVLDVYTPENLETTSRLPVMVFFHGGAYYYGGKTLYNPEFIVEKNVIVVTVNYRLSVHGFLCVNGVSNLGLWDQVAALKWIQKNIPSFGGDPDNVTLCGHSAGASSSSMHFLSKESEGLFHKAILMSGTALAPWAFNLEPFEASLEDARKISEACNEEDIYRVFSNASLEDLVEATKDVSVNPRYFKYSPCVDANSTQPFFHDKPYNILTSGKFNKVPTMVGYTDAEGITFYGLSDQTAVEQFDKYFVERLSSVFSWCSEKDRRKIAKKIRSYYFGREPITRSSVRGLVDYFSDWIAYGTVHAFSKLLMRLSNQPVYNYQFSYTGHRNYIKTFVGLRAPGAAHSDELFYLFKPAGLPLWLAKEDRLVIDRITTVFTNFMKYGNPTPSTSPLVPLVWPPATANATNTLKLDSKLSIIEAPRENFFESVLCEYGESGYVPCDSAEKCNRRKRPSPGCRRRREQ